MFNGENTFAWLSKAERFFRLGNYSDKNKLHMVAVSLEGLAIGWFNGEINYEPFRDWNNFKDRLLLRFSEINSRGPTQSICCIKQLGSTMDYVAHFEDLAGLVTNLDMNTLEGIFLNGLKGPLRATVEMMRPTTLTEMKAYALSLDSKMLTKILAKEMQTEQRSTRSSYNNETRPQLVIRWKHTEGQQTYNTWEQPTTRSFSYGVKGTSSRQNYRLKITEEERHG